MNGPLAPPRPERRGPRRGIALLLVLLPVVTVGCNLFQAPTQPAVQNIAPRVTAVMAAPDSGVAPLTVEFTGAASDTDGTIAAYHWDFGDGASSNLRLPQHVYEAPGDFDASFMATDDKGATASRKVRIHVRAATNQPPSATASASPASGVAPLAVSFTGGGSDADGSIVSWQWSFGDGASSSVQNPSHTFTSTGTYSVRLTVTDNGGATGRATVQVSVTSPANQPPSATAAATPTSGTAPLAVAFTGSGTDPDGTIASYAWTFGDGGTSTAQNPSHTYAAAGSYTARLTVTDNLGATGSATVAITATSGPNQAPTATASATPRSGDAPLAVAFTGSGTDPDGTIASYAWTFGDGGTSTAQNPSHTYAAAGSYTARLTVTDNLGATGSATVAITANTPSNFAPVANAGADQLNKDPGTTFTLDGTGSSDPDGSIVSYAWTQVSGPAVTLAGASTARPSFVSPTAVTASYGFALTVADNGSPAKTATDTVVVSTRVTYNNLVGALLLARGTQSNGQLLGCTSSGCHDGTNSLSPLSTYAQVYSARTSVKSKISSGGSMLKFLLVGENTIIIAWINAGAVEKN